MMSSSSAALLGSFGTAFCSVARFPLKLELDNFANDNPASEAIPASAHRLCLSASASRGLLAQNLLTLGVFRSGECAI
jgi:hypothetical protein